jgi:hypothetical protein
MASRNRRIIVLRLFVALIFSSILCGAQERISTMTRSVQQFGELERQLAGAKDASAQSALLAEDFEDRRCSEPGNPIPRQDWLQESSPEDMRFTQQAVHMFTDAAVYSSLVTIGDKRLSLVDVWKKSGDLWLLQVRYECPATGRKPPQDVIPKRY